MAAQDTSLQEGTIGGRGNVRQGSPVRPLTNHEANRFIQECAKQKHFTIRWDREGAPHQDGSTPRSVAVKTIKKVGLIDVYLKKINSSVKFFPALRNIVKKTMS